MIDRIRCASTGLMVLVFTIAAANAAIAADDEGWGGDVGISFTQQSGTTNTVAGTLDVKVGRDWEHDEVDLRGLANYGASERRNDGRQITQNSQGFFGDWKHTFSDRFFAAQAMEVSRDATQDRDLRVALSTGPGFRAWLGEDAAKEHFDLSAGIGYRYEVFDGNNGDATVNKSQDNFVDVVAAFEYKNMLFDDRVAFTHTGSARMPANRPNNYILRTEVTLGVPLTEAWDLRAGFLAEYIKVTPKAAVGLTTRTTVGLGYKF